MTELVWSVKLSLLQYVANMPDGDIRLEGVSVQDDGLHFPADADHPGRYRGRVAVRGHGGLLEVSIVDPGLEDGDTLITVATADGQRVGFAQIDGWEERDGGRSAHGTVLAATGAAHVFGAYPAGTKLDDPSVL